jgi:hypothetical protein
MFIKAEICEPSTCESFRCETFSDGTAQGLPSHIARCRWLDSRSKTSASQSRCAYVHYSVDSQANGFKNLFLSAQASSDTCARDKEFSALIKDSQGYSGRVP